MIKNYDSIKRFIKYKKWEDFYRKDSIAIPIAIFMTIVFMMAFFFLDVYSDFEYFQDDLKNLLLYVIAALAGLVGILLAGMSFISSIAHTNKNEEALEVILVTFEFLSFIVGIQMFGFMLIFLCLSSNKALINIWLFYLISALSIYILSFTIFYIITIIVKKHFVNFKTK